MTIYVTCLTCNIPTPTVSRNSPQFFVDIVRIRIIFNQFRMSTFISNSRDHKGGRIVHISKCNACPISNIPMTTTADYSSQVFVDLMIIRIILKSLRSAKQPMNHQKKKYHSQFGMQHLLRFPQPKLHLDSRESSYSRRHHDHPYNKYYTPSFPRVQYLK